MEIEITLNGENTRLSLENNESTLKASRLLEKLSIDPKTVALEVNRRVLAREDWSREEIPPGAEVEIFRYVGGG